MIIKVTCLRCRLLMVGVAVLIAKLTFQSISQRNTALTFVCACVSVSVHTVCVLMALNHQN